MATLRRVEAADLHVLEVDAEVEIGRELLKVGEGVDVVAILGLAQIGAAGGGLGQRGFDLHHRRSFFGGLCRAVAGQREHLGDVLDVLLADLLEALACRRCSSRDRAAKARPGEICAICLDESFSSCWTPKRKNGAGAPSLRQIAHQRGDLLGAVERGDLVERRLQRLQPLLVRRGRYSCRRRKKSPYCFSSGVFGSLAAASSSCQSR